MFTRRPLFTPPPPLSRWLTHTRLSLPFLAMLVVPVVLTFSSFGLSFITRTYSLTYDQSGMNTVVMGSETKSYTLIEVVNAVGAEGGGVNGFLVAVMYFFAVVLALVQPVAIVGVGVALFLGVLPVAKYGVCAHVLQLLNEWASLDVCCLSAIVLSGQIGMMAESMSETMGYVDEPEKAGALMELAIDLDAGVWVGLMGGFSCLWCGWKLSVVLQADAAGNSESKVAPEEK